MGTDVNNLMEKERWFATGFILASGLLLSVNLWSGSLENHGYLRYAEIAREMIRSGDWLVPRHNGEIFLNKPPFLFWLIALPSYFYGSVTPLIARFPSFLAAWAGAVVVFFWARRVYGATLPGLVAGGVLVSTYQYFFQSRLARTDMLFGCFVLLSLYFFCLGDGPSRFRRSLFIGLSFLSMGLGTLAKGPSGFIVPWVVVVFELIRKREIRRLASREFGLGYLVFLLTILPWPLLFINRVGFDQSILLVKGSQIASRKNPIYYYFVQIWVQYVPWSLFIPYLLYGLWEERKEPSASQRSFFILWFGTVFILLTLFQYKASRYLLPALPAFALLIGGLWKTKFSYFLIPFILSLLAWYSVDLHWMRKDVLYSPGRELVRELKPLVEDASLFGYELDLNTIEEVNFYLERVIPAIKKPREIASRLQEEGKTLVLMPKGAYDPISRRGVLPPVLTKEFPYKEGSLVLLYR